MAQAEEYRFKVVDATKNIDDIADLVWLETGTIIKRAGIS
jgi:thymidylate kinase